MKEKIIYYADLISELCGFDGSAGSSLLGWVMVSLATAIVIATFYIWITRTLWPGEQDTDHIKRRILIDDEVPHAN